MNGTAILKVTTPSDREVQMTRVFDAPSGRRSNSEEMGRVAGRFGSYDMPSRLLETLDQENA